MTPDERWLAAVWPFVRGWLPSASAKVLEIGCGPLGGFVPRLAEAGYKATGIDPEAPQGPSYRQAELTRTRPSSRSAAASARSPRFDGVPELLVLSGGQHETCQFQNFVSGESFGYRYGENPPPL